MLQSLFTVLPFTVSLFWTVLFVFEWRMNYAAQRILTLFLAVCALLYFCHAAFFNHEENISAFTNSVYAFCTIAVYPLYYLYICRLTGSKNQTMSKLWVLLPALILGILAVVFYVINISHHYIFINKVRLAVSKIVFILQLILVAWFGYRRLLNFDKRLLDYYSNVECRSVAHTRYMLIILIIFSIISAISNIVGREFFYNKPLLLVLPSLIFSMLIFSVAYVGYKQKFNADDFEGELKLPDIVQPLSELEPNRNDIIFNFEKLMKEDKPFLNPDLRLGELAKMLSTNRTTLSNFINQNYHISFSDYINSLRIEHAQKLMLETDEKSTMKMICENSGFNNPASFYRTFRKLTGMTPKQWQISIKRDSIEIYDNNINLEDK